MQNRIRELRKSQQLSQDQALQGFNEYLERKNVKPITKATLSRWENAVNSPTKAMWENLADYFKVSASYLKGVPDKEFIYKTLKSTMMIAFGDINLKIKEIDLDSEELRYCIIMCNLMNIAKELNFVPQKALEEVNEKIKRLDGNTSLSEKALETILEDIKNNMDIVRQLTDLCNESYLKI